MFYHYSNCCRIRYIMVPPLLGPTIFHCVWPGLVGRVQHRPDWLVLQMRHQPRGCRDSSGLLGSLVGPGKSTNHWHVRHLTRDKQGNKQMQWRTANLATKIMLPSSGSSTYLWFHLLQAHLSQCCNVLPPGICPLQKPTLVSWISLQQRSYSRRQQSGGIAPHWHLYIIYPLVMSK